MKAFFTILFFLMSCVLNAQSISGYIETEHRYFIQEGLYSEQKNYYPSFASELEYNTSFNDGSSQVKAIVFGRYDLMDKKRSHIEIREMYYQKSFKYGYTSLGFKKIFWGVVESTNINDIINQKDMLEGINEDYKLGEFMWQNVFINSFGTFETYIMPYHRIIEFPGVNGRLRPPTDLDLKDNSVYENDLENLYPSAAVRYKNTFGNFDMGINYFHGLSREPEILLELSEIDIFYPVINQIGGDFQYTFSGLLLKSEAIYQISRGSNFGAFVGGFEYTLSNFLNTGGDLGIVCEYLYDERGNKSIRGMDNDLFLGLRFSGNDISSTQVLIGGILDMSKSTQIYSFTASRRLNEILKLEIKGNWFHNVSQEEFLYLFKNDSMIQLKLLMYIL
jgi:hypothetical protein